MAKQNTFHCEMEKADFVAAEAEVLDGIVSVSVHEGKEVLFAALNPDNAIALGQHLIELGQQLKVSQNA